ncbi:hypothetical protein KAU11_03870 [Candidatus Babeliales bacterium]|nr:hypothetical protein [Candidatus Babeliales bacterium]
MKRKSREKHGMSNTSIYRIWVNMQRRCNYPKDPSYKYYGGRGIKVCERWNSFKNFYLDMGDKPEGLTLERKDNNGNYEPGNCEWASRKTQTRNSRPNSCGPNKQRWFRAWHKDSMAQHISNNQCKFAKQHGLKQGSISYCLQGIQNHYHGWKFRKI